jgi:hypothetical protein
MVLVSPGWDEDCSSRRAGGAPSQVAEFACRPERMFLAGASVCTVER